MCCQMPKPYHPVIQLLNIIRNKNMDVVDRHLIWSSVLVYSMLRTFSDASYTVGTLWLCAGLINNGIIL